MWQVFGPEGCALDFWERCKTEKGISYYIHHGNKQTQWDHPLLISAMEEVSGCNAIKYAAYRTASKVRILQKFTKLNLVTLPTIISVFDQHGFGLEENEVSACPDELESLLTDIFCMTKRNPPSQAESKFLAVISMNLLVNIYDSSRKGMIKARHAKVALTLLSSARLQEKYKYLFRQFADHNNIIIKEKLVELLKCFAEITEYLSEKPSFGSQLVNAAVESCCHLQSSSVGIGEESFLDWLLCEPQTLVWISTLYRLASAESVEHEVKCSACKTYPVIGLRYQCLRCFHYNLCQQCFFKGAVSKQHKLYHPMQEYCHKSTSKEGTRALMKTIKNRCSKKTTAKCKQRYLPIISDPVTDNNRNVVNEFECSNNGSSTISENKQTATIEKASKMLQTDSLQEMEGVLPVLHSSTDTFDSSFHENLEPENTNLQELESIILHLELENRHLIVEIEKLHKMGSGDVTDSTSRAQQEQSIARRIALEDHNHQLELQLQRLKSLQQYFRKSFVEDHPAVNLKPTLALLSPRMESTPVGKTDYVQFTFRSEKGDDSEVEFPSANDSSPSTFQLRDREWPRPFCNQPGFVRRSLPPGTFQRSLASPSSSGVSTFQRASARAILQNVEFSTSPSVPATHLEQGSVVTGKYQKIPKPFHMTARSSTHYTFSNVSKDIASTQKRVQEDEYLKSMLHTSLNFDSSEGLNRIQAELDAIIRQLEIVYPGCSSQKSESNENSRFGAECQQIGIGAEIVSRGSVIV